VNLPAVDLTIAAAIFASVASLQVAHQIRRVMKRHPGQAGPPFRRRLVLVLLLSGVALLAVPALAGMFLSQLGSSQVAAGPDLTKRQASAQEAAPSSPAAAFDASESTQTPVAAPPAAPAPVPAAAPVSIRPSAPIVTPTLKNDASAPATEEPEALSSDSAAVDAGPAETEQSEPEQSEPQTDEAAGQPEQEQEQEQEPEGLFESGEVELPLDPGLPGVGR
jgi:hypothetical protein